MRFSNTNVAGTQPKKRTILAEEIYVDSYGRIGLGETSQRRQSRGGSTAARGKRSIFPQRLSPLFRSFFLFSKHICPSLILLHAWPASNVQLLHHPIYKLVPMFFQHYDFNTFLISLICSKCRCSCKYTASTH
ncbi:hypothetical protein D8M04_11955 [Oceanobacillus piezotolerans]|uniref:Uncharacterized protein n=1 Tax=Oceanobacillus piezotolerans TaxID=2448030 RepID=A0A498DBZ3_9BACI|nr:hypothetical protein D8M04_11955 [Oceanobacillus piezotolerans]